MSYKKYTVYTLILLITSFLILGSFVFYVDPYFHYHKPYLDYYSLNNQRYQNNGIVRNFDYDAVITGTSMTENFKTSEFDQLFSVNSIKVPFSGGSFKEINDNLKLSLQSRNVKIVIRCLDLYRLEESYDKMSYDADLYPTYLYDNNYFNDVNYLLNKDSIISSIRNVISSINKEQSTTFDDYSSWNNSFVYNKEQVDLRYFRSPKSEEYTITNEDYNNIKNNILINVVQIAKDYPDVDFYYYFPPYNIYYWDEQNQIGNLKRRIDIIEYATQLMIEQPNIHLFSFLSEFDIITDFNNYKDCEHYSGAINSLILQKMKNNDDLLNEDNYQNHISIIREFYYNHDYNQYFN